VSCRLRPHDGAGDATPGWHTLSFEEVVTGAPVEVQRAFKMSPYSLFTILFATNRKPALS